jgi:hypothetical protein
MLCVTWLVEEASTSMRTLDLFFAVVISALIALNLNGTNQGLMIFAASFLSAYFLGN